MLATVAAERPDTADALLLIDELQTHLESFYPPESRHGFSVERLIKEGVAFFVLRVDGAPAGCGGIKLFGRARASERGHAAAPRDRHPPAGRDPAVRAPRVPAHPAVRALHRRPGESLLREVTRAGLARSR